MINLRYVYNRNKKSLTKRLNDFDFEQMERDAKKLFNLGERPLLFYYFDETNCKILILDEDDFTEIMKLATARITPTKIYLNLREKIIAEIDNPELLQGFFMKEFMRRQRKCGGFNKKKLIHDLHSLRDSLQIAQIKPKQTRKILAGISKEIQMHFVDESFSERGLDYEEEGGLGDASPQNDPSFSSILDKQTTASFFSRNELAVFGEVARHKQPSNFRWKNKEDIEGPVACRTCREDLTEQMRFECEKCRRFVLCDGCFKGVKHKHPLKPFFIINDSKQKITAINRIFKKIKFNRAEFFFDVLKKGLYRLQES